MRTILTLLAAAVLAATSASAETLRVGKAGREAFSFVPVDIGVRTGIFKQQNLDIEIANFGGDAKLQQAMAADGIDIALGSGPGLAFIVKGSPVRGIAAMAGPPLLFALHAVLTGLAIALGILGPVGGSLRTLADGPVSPAAEQLLVGLLGGASLALVSRSACWRSA